MPTERRLTAIETSMAHLEHLVEQLDEVVVDHTRTIASLERVVRELRGRIARLEAAGAASPKGLDTGGAAELTEGYEFGLDRDDQD
ncbi:MAG: SlyX family protein [Planctomycetota bacterium]